MFSVAPIQVPVIVSEKEVVLLQSLAALIVPVIEIVQVPTLAFDAENQDAFLFIESNVIKEDVVADDFAIE